jgi:hypothetical protein
MRERLRSVWSRLSVSARAPGEFPGRAGPIIGGRVNEHDLEEAARRHELAEELDERAEEGGDHDEASDRRPWYGRIFRRRAEHSSAQTDSSAGGGPISV